MSEDRDAKRKALDNIYRIYKYEIHNDSILVYDSRHPLLETEDKEKAFDFFNARRAVNFPEVTKLREKFKDRFSENLMIRINNQTLCVSINYVDISTFDDEEVESLIKEWPKDTDAEISK